MKNSRMIMNSTNIRSKMGKRLPCAYYTNSMFTPLFTLDEAKEAKDDDPLADESENEFICATFGTWEYFGDSDTLIKTIDGKTQRVFSVADDGTLKLKYDEICFVAIGDDAYAFAKEGDDNIVLYFWESSEEDLLAGTFDEPLQGGYRGNEKWEYDVEEHTLAFYYYNIDDGEWNIVYVYAVNDDGTLDALL